MVKGKHSPLNMVTVNNSIMTNGSGINQQPGTRLMPQDHHEPIPATASCRDRPLPHSPRGWIGAGSAVGHSPTLQSSRDVKRVLQIIL